MSVNLLMSQKPTYTAAIIPLILVGSLLTTSAGFADQSITITTDRLIYTVDEGRTLGLTISVKTKDDQPLTATRTVTYTTTDTTTDTAAETSPIPLATAKADYAPARGQLRFPAGTRSGHTKRVTIPIINDRDVETAERIPLTLKADDTTITTPTILVNANGLPYLNQRLPIEQRVKDLVGRMTIDEKIGQMTQDERATFDTNRTMISKLMLGSLLSGGGSVPTPNTPAAWVQMVNDYQTYALATRLQIPLIYGVDAVHGHNNLSGATVFPHNIGLGATRNPELAKQLGHATATEVRATGVPWNFAPCICVTLDERWGRSYESFSEDPALVVRMEPIVQGLQGDRPDQLNDPDRVLATVKHYAGDGGTRYDDDVAAANVGRQWWEQKYTIDQGITVTSRENFQRTALLPYAKALSQQHCAGSVMPSFSSVDFTDDGVGNPVKMHANKELVTDVLKDQMGFDGFVISDWLAIHQIPDPQQPTVADLTDYKVRTAVNAGTDMFMEPNNAPRFVELLLAEVRAGRVSQARIDDAVTRILRKKMQLGLFEHPYAPTDRADLVGNAAHRALGRQAAAQSQVLLKNSQAALPLRPDTKLYVAGRNADNIGNQSGGWTLTWQGVSGDSIPGTTILEGIREVAPQAQITYSADASAPVGDADVGIVVVGETPYAEGYGDVGGPECGWCTPEQQEEKSLELQPSDQAVIDKVCSTVGTCVVLIVSGRPQIIGKHLDSIDALVASWLPGSEGAGVADILFGQQPFTGRLPVTWPRSADQVPINVGDATYNPLYPYGWGLRTDSAQARLQQAVKSVTREGVLPQDIRQALTSAYWNTDGSVRDRAAVLAHLTAVVEGLRGRQGHDVTALLDAVVSVARDLAQQAVIAGTAPEGWATHIAEADHALAEGNAVKAYENLARITG